MTLTVVLVYRSATVVHDSEYFNIIRGVALSYNSVAEPEIES